MHYAPDWMEQADWFALSVRTNYENIAATALEGLRLGVFVPTALVKKRYSDRIKVVEKPLFPGYLFCHFAPKNLLNVLQSTAVLNVVRVGRRPEPIAREVIDALRLLQRSGLVREATEYAVGQPVVVNSGSLEGVHGSVIRHAGQDRLLISVSLLQRSVRVEVDSWRLAPLRPVDRSSARPVTQLDRAS